MCSHCKETSHVTPENFFSRSGHFSLCLHSIGSCVIITHVLIIMYKLTIIMNPPFVMVIVLSVPYTRRAIYSASVQWWCAGSLCAVGGGCVPAHLASSFVDSMQSYILLANNVNIDSLTLKLS